MRFLFVKFVCFLWSSWLSFPLVGTICLHHIFNFFQLTIISDMLSSPHFFSLKLVDLLLSRPCAVLRVIASLSFCSFPSPHTVLKPEGDICHFIWLPSLWTFPALPWVRKFPTLSILMEGTATFLPLVPGQATPKYASITQWLFWIKLEKQLEKKILWLPVPHESGK